ncbi:putative UDP-glucosyltransferase YojK [Brevipalpus obovatus]|uniref:putative UDP-glucosyltransferase YojK n=1 Tax=Brevipalpus obovatus TaxID=246614 RepID=UPI003D9EB569
MGKSYRFLLSAMSAMGHLNATVGFGDLLKSRGHHVIFAQNEKFRKIAEMHGFEFVPFDEDIMGEDDAGRFFEWVLENSHYFGANWIERVKNMTEEDAKIFASMMEGNKKIDKALDKILETIGPIDCVVYDILAVLPCFVRRRDLINIPLLSSNPISIYPSGPNHGGGFSLINFDPAEWTEYADGIDRMWSGEKKMRREWLASEGMESIADELDNKHFIPRPDYFGFYHYPEDLDYTELGEREPGWIRIDSCVREDDPNTKFEVPEVLKDKPGKLIYFSLGSLASCDHKAMRRILDILAKSPHRFIVSTGHFGDKLELADNMWGEPYVDQIKILQAVDMAIIHGGNNSFVEALYYARPIIVIPYFFDQLDNAQRIEDKGLGRRVDLWNTSETELLKIIEDTLTNTEVHEKIRKISENMRSSTSREGAAKMIEDLIKERKKSKTEIQ